MKQFFDVFGDYLWALMRLVIAWTMICLAFWGNVWAAGVLVWIVGRIELADLDLPYRLEKLEKKYEVRA